MCLGFLRGHPLRRHPRLRHGRLLGGLRLRRRRRRPRRGGRAFERGARGRCRSPCRIGTRRHGKRGGVLFREHLGGCEAAVVVVAIGVDEHRVSEAAVRSVRVLVGTDQWLEHVFPPGPVRCRKTCVPVFPSPNVGSARAPPAAHRRAGKTGSGRLVGTAALVLQIFGSSRPNRQQATTYSGSRSPRGAPGRRVARQTRTCRNPPNCCRTAC